MVGASILSSWPGLSHKSGLPDLCLIINSQVGLARLAVLSTSCLQHGFKDVDARHKACARAGLRPDPSAGHDDVYVCA